MANGTMTTVGLVKAIGGPVALLSVLGFMGTGIIENDRRNSTQHTEIVDKMITRDEAIGKRVEEVKDIVSDIRVEQKALKIFLEKKL